MMKRIISLLIVCLSFVVSFGETVSQKQAQHFAQLFFNEAAGKVTAPPKLIYNGRKLTTNRLFTPFYVYNTALGGFVIISAENKAYPILGYSLKNGFEQDRLGDAEIALLKSYALEIEYVRYDGQPVDDVAKAWQDYAGYVRGILNAGYQATDPKITVEESLSIIENAIEKDDAAFSDIYTPAQWRDMIIDELNLKESAPLAFVNDEELIPAVVYGHKGDYFRLELSERNSWLMRLNATDVIPANMVSAVVNPIEFPFDMAEELPFETHDAFLAETYEIEENRMSRSSIDIPLLDEKPIVKANGGGHFEVLMPENVSIVLIYNLAGSIVRKFSYRNTQVANIDISAEPSGFYFITLIGDSGKPFGIKLYR